MERARDLGTYCHPERAIYLLGGEDKTISEEAQQICTSIVKFNSKFCLNVAVAGSIVLYDRSTKETNQKM